MKFKTKINLKDFLDHKLIKIRKKILMKFKKKEHIILKQKNKKNKQNNYNKIRKTMKKLRRNQKK